MNKHDHLHLAVASIKVFTDDGLLDERELDSLLALAERDATITDDEKRVLGKIFTQAESTQLDPVVATRIADVRKQHGIA